VAADEVLIDAWDLAHGTTARMRCGNDQDQRILRRSSAPLAAVGWKGLGAFRSVKRRATQRVA